MKPSVKLGCAISSPRPKVKFAEVGHPRKRGRVPQILKVADHEIIKMLQGTQQIDNFGKITKSPNGQLMNNLLEHPTGRPWKDLETTTTMLGMQ